MAIDTQARHAPMFLTLEEAAGILRVPLDYVYDLSAQDKLPGKVKIGRRTVRVNSEQFLAWVKSLSG